MARPLGVGELERVSEVVVGQGARLLGPEVEVGLLVVWGDQPWSKSD